MKGSASAKLPALHTGSLVASPCANPCSKRKKNEKTKKAKDRKEKKTHMPQLDCEGIVKNCHETGTSDIITTGNSKAAKKKLKLTLLLPNDKVRNLEQRKMAQLEAHLRHKGTNYREKRLLRESSVTSLRQSRLVSAKSRDHLLSLIPTKDALENNRNCNYQNIVSSAKRELDWIKKFDRSGRPSRRESGELHTLFKQTKNASRLREPWFGKQEKAPTNVDHVIDSYSKRAYFLSPISAQDLSTSSNDHNKCKDGQIKWREHLQINPHGQNNVKARIDLNIPRIERSIGKKKMNGVEFEKKNSVEFEKMNGVEFDFYV